VAWLLLLLLALFPVVAAIADLVSDFGAGLPTDIRRRLPLWRGSSGHGRSDRARGRRAPPGRPCRTFATFYPGDGHLSTFVNHFP